MVQSKLLTKFPDLMHFFGDKNSSFRQRNIIMAEQVHGDKVAVVTDNREKIIKNHDGLVTNKPILLCIRTADCLPIFFYDPRTKIIAAIHAGWKGLFAGIIRNAVFNVKKLGGKIEDLLVSIGPHIQVCCYRVTDDRIAKFSKFKNVASGWFLNLSQVAAQQLLSNGILKRNIEISPTCTCCDSRFWSFRRDGQDCGRMINVIGIKENL